MSLFNIGLSGLLASQAALSTVGHNISNANTPGYSRQRVDLVARPPQVLGGLFFGNGVEISNVSRVYDGFLTGQVQTASSNAGSARAFYNLAAQVDKLVADPEGGLAPVLQNFFDAAQDVADDPSSIPAREVLLAQGQALDQRFQSLNGRLSELQGGFEDMFGDVLTEINTLADGIANLNQDIALAQGARTEQEANDLQDARDELVRQLAGKVDITVFRQDDGSVNIAVGSGQSLVANTSVNHLSAMDNPYDPTVPEVGYTAGGSTVAISDLIRGGELDGLLDFRGQVLEPALNALGRVAIGLADSFNAQHSLGMDLDGNLGGAFFTNISSGADATPTVAGHQQNAASATITATITSIGDLTTSDYRLDSTAGGLTLTRLDDGAVTSLAGFAIGTPVEVDGVTLDWSAGTLPVGDSYLIRPTRFASRDFGVQPLSAREVAAAAPIRTLADLGNTGSAAVSAGAVNTPPPADANLRETVTITFTGAGTFNVTGTGTGDPVGVAYSAGADISYNGWTVRISGTPVAGDVFVVESNSGGVGDNRNALLLAGQQTDNSLDGGSTTLAEAYAGLVAQVGSSTRQVEINLGAQETLLSQATAARDNMSGVNLDEEAASLIRYQQAYQASAQIIAAADSVFQTLLRAVGG